MANKRTMMISIILAFVSMALVYSYINQKEEEFNKKYGTLVNVVIADRQINSMEPIQMQWLKTIEIPSKFKQPKTVDKPDFIVNYLSQVPIAPGEQISTTKLLDAISQTGIANMITIGKRAFTLSVTRRSSVGMKVEPGNRIDIMMTCGEVEKGAPILKTRFAFQDVLVLATGNSVLNQLPISVETNPDTGETVTRRLIKGKVTYRDITVELSADAVLHMQHLVSKQCQMVLALRNPFDRAKPDIASVDDSKIGKGPKE